MEAISVLHKIFVLRKNFAQSLRNTQYEIRYTTYDILFQKRFEQFNYYNSTNKATNVSKPGYPTLSCFNR